MNHHYGTESKPTSPFNNPFNNAYYSNNHQSNMSRSIDSRVKYNKGRISSSMLRKSDEEKLNELRNIYCRKAPSNNHFHSHMNPSNIYNVNKPPNRQSLDYYGSGAPSTNVAMNKLKNTLNRSFNQGEKIYDKERDDPNERNFKEILRKNIPEKNPYIRSTMTTGGQNYNSNHIVNSPYSQIQGLHFNKSSINGCEIENSNVLLNKPKSGYSNYSNVNSSHPIGLSQTVGRGKLDNILNSHKNSPLNSKPININYNSLNFNNDQRVNSSHGVNQNNYLGNNTKNQKMENLGKDSNHIINTKNQTNPNKSPSQYKNPRLSPQLNKESPHLNSGNSKTIGKNPSQIRNQSPGVNKISSSNTKKPTTSNSQNSNSYIFPIFNPSAKCVKEFAYKEECNSEYRNKMEDFCKIIDRFMNDNNKGLFCLYDGHGGAELVKYVRDRMPEVITKFINEFKDIEKALTFSFQKIDDELKVMSDSQNTGSTACVTLINCEGDLSLGSKRVLYTANVGDTRAILISKSDARRLSYDHKCIDEAEASRIRKTGGVVFNGRVFGQLALSRALGDHAMKKYGVVPTPYIAKHTISEKDRYVVMCSDGVWDALDEAKVFELSLKCSNADELSDLIVKRAVEIGSRDNISCIVIKVN